MLQPHVARFVRFLRKRDNRPDFSMITDPRKRRGRRWSLNALLSAIFIGMMALETSLRGVERLTRDLEGCRRLLGLGRRVPDSTLARLLPQLTDERGLRQVLISQIRRAERRKALEPARLSINMVVVDGQSIWCSDQPVDDPACQKMKQDAGAYYRLHALHAVLVSATSQPCIDQLLVHGKTNECAKYASFVTRLHATYGRSQQRLELIANDAGMTSAANARHTNSLGLAYLMAVKGNQPTLLAEAKRLCGWGEHKQVGYVCEASTLEPYRGKTIRRELYRSRAIEGWPEWESARQTWRIKQTTTHKDGRVEVDNRYFVTNLAWGRLGGHAILAVVRQMWGIENGCHWTLDVVMKQGTQPWCTKGKALRALSWLRLLAYNALRLFKERYLRSSSSRAMPWDECRRLLNKALTDARPWHRSDIANAEVATATL